MFRPTVLRANRHLRETPTTSALVGHSPSGAHGAELLPPKFKFHGLRHTYASLCAAAGIDVAEVSRNLGHSKVTTTLDIYTHTYSVPMTPPVLLWPS